MLCPCPWPFIFCNFASSTLSIKKSLKMWLVAAKYIAMIKLLFKSFSVSYFPSNTFPNPFLDLFSYDSHKHITYFIFTWSL